MLSTLKEAHKTAKYLLKTGFLRQLARNPVVNFTTVQWSKTVSIKARTVQAVVSFESGSKLDRRQQALEKIIDSPSGKGEL